MASLAVFVIGAVLGAFFPNTIKPRVLKAWGKLKEALHNPYTR